MNKTHLDAEQALASLLKKYHVHVPEPFHLDSPDDTPGLHLVPGWKLTGKPLNDHQIPLLSWRAKRKFIELKKIVKEATVENPRMFRFSCTGNKDRWHWQDLLYRELDICEFIGDSSITSLQAAITDNETGNIILRLDNGILCSIEISILLPSGKALADRHEIIAQRGVASDLVVDTMIPQNSIYTYTESGENHYKDTDEELFGFDEEQIDLIRAGFLVLKEKGLSGAWRARHDHLTNLVKAVFESGKNRKKSFINSMKI